MYIDTQTSFLDGKQDHVRLLQTPDKCPICHKHVHPKYLITTQISQKSLCQAVFRCTNHDCEEIFIATYRKNFNLSAPPQYELIKTAPISARKIEFQETIVNISPTFIEIYNQSIEAETKQLDQLVGIGMRKALEFLVKDYTISEHPEKTEQIKTITLSQCINDYISDVNIRECAKRAAWLGNDETHYIKKWETKDISDLKLLVQLTVNWIDSSALTKKYISDMETGKSHT